MKAIQICGLLNNGHKGIQVLSTRTCASYLVWQKGLCRRGQGFELGCYSGLSRWVWCNPREILQQTRKGARGQWKQRVKRWHGGAGRAHKPECQRLPVAKKAGNRFPPRASTGTSLENSFLTWFRLLFSRCQEIYLYCFRQPSLL